MSLKEKCPIYYFNELGDDRGHLVVIEGGQSIPFNINRIFYIYGSALLCCVFCGEHGKSGNCQRI